jgi:hypothetical protein
MAATVHPIGLIGQWQIVPWRAERASADDLMSQPGAG